MSKIEWTDKTWNPVVGCTKVSPGCEHCYAERMAYRLACMDKKLYTTGVVRGIDGRAEWTGQIGIAPEKIWTQPLHWRKPRRIFVCSMGDLFHENVPQEAIFRVFATAWENPRHTFQILTKRPKRMRVMVSLMAATRSYPGQWPIPNVWLGVTAENQEAADKRIPLLLNTPAAVRFVSCEPLLGPIDLNGTPAGQALGPCDECGHTDENPSCESCDGTPSLDWIIAGGETGPGARPMHPDWIRSIRDQCKDARVPFLFKQWGDKHTAPVVSGYNPDAKKGGRLLDGVIHDAYPKVTA